MQIKLNRNCVEQKQRWFRGAVHLNNVRNHFVNKLLHLSLISFNFVLLFKSFRFRARFYQGCDLQGGKVMSKEIDFSSSFTSYHKLPIL